MLICSQKISFIILFRMIRFLLILGFFFSTNVSAQSIVIKGVVMDSIVQTSITGVTVIIQSEDQILGYGITNNKGIFEISFNNVNNREIIIHCRHVSYAEKKIILQQSQFTTPIKILLNTSSKTLSEIIVQSDSWTKHDTTNFIIDSTIDVRAKKIEDVLRTLPDFEIKPNGKIMYNNRPIETVLVNGENLTGSNYGVVTKNLDADVLNKVQVIDNFSENRIIGSVFKTGDLALNLITKEEMNGKINGSIKAGTSFFKKNLADLNLIGIKNRTQGLLVGDWNNIGENNNPDYKNTNRSAVYSQVSRENDYFTTTPISAVSFPLMEDNYKPDEKNGGVFASINFPISTKIKLTERFGFRTLKNSLSAFQYNKTILPDSSSYELFDQQHADFKSSEWSNAVTLKFDNMKRTAMEAELSVLFRNSNSYFNQLQTGSYNDSAFTSSEVPYTKYAFTLSGATRIAKHKAIGFGVNAFVIKDEGSVDFNTNRLYDFYNLEASYQNFRQTVHQNNAVAIFDVLYLSRLKRGSMSMKLSQSMYQNELNRFVFVDTVSIGKEASLISDGVKNFKYTKTTFQVTTNHNTNNHTQLKFDAAIGLYSLQGLSTKNYLYYAIYGEMQGKLFKNVRFGTALSSRTSLASPGLILKDSLIEQLSFITLATPHYKPITQHYYAFTLTKNGWYDYRLSYNFRWNPKSYTTQVLYDPKLSFSFYNLLGENLEHNAQFNLKAYSLKLKGTFHVNLAAKQQTNNGVVNDVPVTNVVKSLSPSLRYISNFKGAYTIEVIYKHNFNHYKQKGQYDLSLSNSDYLVSLSQRVIFSKKIAIQISNAYQKFQSGEFTRFEILGHWFADKNWHITIKGANLFNNLSFKNQFNNPNNIYRSETLITEPFVLLSISRKF